MRSRLEALPNIDSVQDRVQHVGPSPQESYTWLVTFTQLPGAHPPFAGVPSALALATNGLTGSNAALAVSRAAGAAALGGTWTLSYGGAGPSVPQLYDVPAPVVRSALKGIGLSQRVAVLRRAAAAGYEWDVALEGCAEPHTALRPAARRGLPRARGAPQPLTATASAAGRPLCAHSLRSSNSPLEICGLHWQSSRAS